MYFIAIYDACGNKRKVGNLWLYNRNQYFKAEAYTDSSAQHTLWNLVRGQSDRKKATKQKQTPKDLWFFWKSYLCVQIVELMHYCGTIKMWSISIPEIDLLAFLQVLLMSCEWEVGQGSHAGQWDITGKKSVPHLPSYTSDQWLINILMNLCLFYDE